MRRIWFPIVAAVVAIAVGVGAYIIANPFAAPTLVEPGYVDGWTVAENNGLMSLVEPSDDSAESEVADAPSPKDSASTLSPARIPVVDPTTPEAVRAMLVDRLALVDALALSGSLPTLGSDVSVIDDCATDDPPADCPTGTRATVLASVRMPDFVIAPSTTRAPCPALINSSSEVGISIVSTRPMTLTATYEVDGTDRRTVVTTDARARATWEASGEAGVWTSIVHCLQLSDLPAGWLKTVRFTADDDAGSTVTSYLRVQTDGGAVVPPFRVDTLTNSAVMISIPAVDVSSVLFSAFAVPFGQPAVGCSFEPNSSTSSIEPAAVIEERLTAPQLIAQNYIPEYNERHSAIFIVPEASTITVCAGWFDSHTWTVPFPDHVYGEVLHSPDLVVPRVTVDSVGLRVRDSGGDMRLTSSVGGTEARCGTVSALTASSIGAVLCDYSPPDYSAGWDAALIVTATATAFGSTGTRTYHLPVAPQVCGLGCDVPEPQFFDIPLDTRSGPCIGNCSDSFAGSVRLRVDWIEGGESWANEWLREGPSDGAPRDPVFDTSATVELGEFDVATETQAATIEVATDRETTVEAVVVRAGEFDAFEIEQTVVDPEFLESRTIRFDGLPAASRTYAVTLTFTDREGNVSTYSPMTEDDNPYWGGGYFRTDPTPVEFEAVLTVRTEDGTPVGVGNYIAGAGSATWQSVGDPVTCSPEEVVVDLGVSSPEGAVGILDGVSIDVVLFEPVGTYSGQVDCSGTERIYLHRWRFDNWRHPVTTFDFHEPLVGIEALRRGVTLTFTEQGYIIELRIVPAT